MYCNIDRGVVNNSLAAGLPSLMFYTSFGRSGAVLLLALCSDLLFVLWWISASLLPFDQPFLSDKAMLWIGLAAWSSLGLLVTATLFLLWHFNKWTVSMKTHSCFSPLPGWVCINSLQNKDCFPVSFFEFLCFYLFHCTHLYQHSHFCHLGTSFFGHSCFPEQTGQFSVKGSVVLSQIWGQFWPQDFVCVLNCCLIVEAMRRLSPGFCLWSWMKLVCGKAKHCQLRCVFLTWNQPALHKYRGFLSQQQPGWPSCQRMRQGWGLSITSAPAPLHLAAGKEGLPSKSFLPVLFSLLLLSIFLPLAWFKALCLDVDVARLPSKQPAQLVLAGAVWLMDFMLFGQAKHKSRQKNAFFWGGCSGTLEIRFFCLADWQLVLLLMMVGKDVGCYN